MARQHRRGEHTADLRVERKRLDHGDGLGDRPVVGHCSIELGVEASCREGRERRRPADEGLQSVAVEGLERVRRRPPEDAVVSRRRDGPGRAGVELGCAGVVGAGGSEETFLHVGKMQNYRLDVIQLARRRRVEQNKSKRDTNVIFQAMSWNRVAELS